MLWKRGVSIFSLCACIAFAIAAIVSNFWVDSIIFSGGNKFTYEIGLREWRLKSATSGDSPYFKLDSNGQFPWFFLESLLGSEKDYFEAGKSAFALGWIGVGLSAVSLVISCVSIANPNIHKALASVPAWVAGFSFLLGAIIYEGMRPTFNGDSGYQWPMGLYLTAGIWADIAAFLMWWADKSNA